MDDNLHGEPSSGARASRRTFLRRTGGWMVAGLGARLFGFDGGLPSSAAEPDQNGRSSALASPSGRRSLLPDHLDRKAFSGCVGSLFVFRGPAGPVELRLDDVRDRPVPSPEGTTGECFSLEFSGPRDSPLEQATYRVDHGRLGACDIFIVPVGADAIGLRYEAIFNRLGT